VGKLERKEEDSFSDSASAEGVEVGVAVKGASKGAVPVGTMDDGDDPSVGLEIAGLVGWEAGSPRSVVAVGTATLAVLTGPVTMTS